MKHFAYLDPGTGSVIVQAIIGAIVGVGYFARKNIGLILTRFRKKSSKKPPQHDD